MRALLGLLGGIRTTTNLSKLRILIAASTFPPDPGGPALHASTYLKGFRERGYLTDVVALAHFRKWPRGVRQIFFFFTIVMKISRYDLIYAHDAVGAGIPAYFAAKLFGRKFVVRVGGDLAWERKAESGTPVSLKEWYALKEHQTDKFFIISRWLLRHADAIIVPSKILKDLYIHDYLVSSNKIFLIPNPVPQKRDEKRSVQTIVYASRLVAYKNLDTVLKALVPIFEVHPELKFIIMGDGPEKNNLLSLAKSLNIEKNVKFLGSVSQEIVDENIASSKLVIAPALTEFSPNYLLKGISFGKPFLVSRENGLPFTVPEELLFQARDTQELSKKIEKILIEENYKKAETKVKEVNFSMTWEKVIEKNLEVIKKILNG